MGQKDDTRENSCVTESKKETEAGKMGEKGRREEGWMGRKGGERDKGVWQRDDFTESEKPTQYRYSSLYFA